MQIMDTALIKLLKEIVGRQNIMLGNNSDMLLVNEHILFNFNSTNQSLLRCHRHLAYSLILRIHTVLNV